MKWLYSESIEEVSFLVLQTTQVLILMGFPGFMPERISSKEGSKGMKDMFLVLYEAKEKKQEILVIDLDSWLKKNINIIAINSS